MTTPQTDWPARARVRIVWWWCILANWIVVHINLPYRVQLWLLPWAGAYSHSYDYEWFCNLPMFRTTSPQRENHGR